jgi:hypothetical protein
MIYIESLGDFGIDSGSDKNTPNKTLVIAHPLTLFIT